MRHFPAVFPWANPPYPPIPQERKNFADYWNAIFGRRLRFTRVEYDGGWVLCPPEDAEAYIDPEHRDEYRVTDVYMTQRQFDALPEFQGF